MLFLSPWVGEHSLKVGCMGVGFRPAVRKGTSPVAHVWFFPELESSAARGWRRRRRRRRPTHPITLRCLRLSLALSSPPKSQFPSSAGRERGRKESNASSVASICASSNRERGSSCSLHNIVALYTAVLYGFAPLSLSKCTKLTSFSPKFFRFFYV